MLTFKEGYDKINLDLYFPYERVNLMKKVYSSPEVMAVVFDTEDVITASGSLLMSGDHHAGSTSAKTTEGVWNEDLSSGV